MKYRSIHNSLFVILCVMTSLMACQHLLPDSKTPTVVSTATFKPMRLAEAELPSFVESKGSLPNTPGTYLVYSELFSAQAGKVKYVSLGGTGKGDLLGYSSIDNWFPTPFMSSGRFTPQFIFTNHHQGEMTLRDRELKVWLTDLPGKLLHRWRLTMEPDSNASCGSPSFSPSGHWLLLICSLPDQYYINLVDLTSGEQKILALSDGITTVPAENWSGDETRFYAWSHTNVYCFISLPDDETVCRDVGKLILSVSPDWNKVVFFKGDMTHDPDGTIPGIQISLVDPECILNGTHCKNSMDFELPFHQSIAGNSSTTPAIELRWNASGSKLAWMNHGYGAQDGNTPSCGWITPSEKNNQMLCGQVENKTSLRNISPDENWLLLSDTQGLYLLSTRDASIQRVISPTQEFGVISFHGWIVIP